MDILKYKGYEGTAELDVSRGICHGKILHINDLVTYETDAPTKLQEMFEEAVDDYVATCAEIGKEPQRAFRGVFNVRVSPELHRAALSRAHADGCTLNEVVARAMEAFLCSHPEVNHNHTHRIVLVTSKSDPVQTVSATRWSTASVH